MPAQIKAQLESRDYVAAHSLWHSRKKAAPADSPWLKDFEPEDFPFGRHKLIQKHENSGRMNLYIANHVHHLETIEVSTKFDAKPIFQRVPEPESSVLIDDLLAHATQPKYTISVEWQSPGDLLVWDNTCVMHRASPVDSERFMGKFRRDMRRCTVHDGSIHAWGLNEKNSKRMGLP